MSALDLPPTQTTAPVFEYRCLFTSDLRRKQKRWQDGQLKFHTFNNRVMVYDDRSNFVGDTHWREDELNEGEELELERRGILVEVGDCTGQRNQDVSELVDKPRKEKEGRAAARAAASPMLREHSTPSGLESVRPKPLLQMLTPSGHYGRAVIPNVSPFEENQRQSRITDESERPSKRRKQAENTSSKNGYAQNLMGASLNLSSSRPPSTATIRYEPLKFKSAPARKPETTIDLTSDSENDRIVSAMQDGVKRVDVSNRPTPTIQKRKKATPVTKSGYASSLTGASLSLSRPPEVAPRRIRDALTGRKFPSPIENDDQSSSAIEEDTHMSDGPRADRHTALVEAKKVGAKTVVSNKNTESLSLKVIFDSRSSSPPIVEMVISTPSKTSTSKQVSRSPQDKSRRVQQGTQESSSPPPMVASREIPHQTMSSKRTATRNSSVNDTGPEKTTSSLRLKSRPRQKMVMLMDRPNSRQRTLSLGDMTASKAPRSLKAAPEDVVLSQASLQLDSFRKRQEERLQARLNGHRSNIDFNESPDSPPDSGIDHRTIDLLLSHKSKQGGTGQENLHLCSSERPIKFSEPANDIKGSPDTDKNQQQSPSDAVRFVENQSSLRTEVSSKATPPRTVESSPNELTQPGHTDPKAIQRKSDTESPRRTQSVAASPTNFTGEMLIDLDPLRGTTNLAAPSSTDALSIPYTSPPSILASQASSGIAYLQSDALNMLYTGRAVRAGERHVAAAEQRAYDLSRPHDKLPLVSESHASPAKNQKQSGSSQYSVTSAEFNIYQMQVEKDVLEHDLTIGDRNNGRTEEQRKRTLSEEAPKAKEPTWHMTSAIQGAVEPRLEPSKSQKGEVSQPAVPQPYNASPFQQSLTTISFPAGIESPTNRSAIKSSPKPSPVEFNPLVEGHSVHNGESLNLKRDPVPSLPQAAVGIALGNTDKAPSPPRARVVNPATRGKSLLTIAASTVDALGQVFSAAMPPPAPRPLNRISRTNPRGEVTVGRAADPTPIREAAKSGPWSRESFDLFGAWKPPEIHAGTNVTAA